MADRLRVRAYNVRFGDALLVTVPDRDPGSGETTRRNLLLDVGNVLTEEGGDDAVFRPVLEDVIRELDGRPLDLYVMTHEHLDHVQGLFYAATKLFPDGGLAQRLKVDYAWLTASAAENYYDTHEEARRKKDLWLEAYRRIESHLRALPAGRTSGFAGLLANNNPRSTGECVAFLRKLAREARTFYVHRQFAPAGKHPFREARLEVWAPEEDTSDYYRGLLPMAFPAAPGPGGETPEPSEVPKPPPGVDAGAFFDLVESRRSGVADNLLAIDRAANNTSVVLCLEWRGRRLLFPGDAELGSWRMMEAKGVLKPVDFLKVGHHGSHNGTPAGARLDAVLPRPATGGKKRRAVISTWTDTYPGIPHEPTNEKLRQRCTLRTTLDDRTKPFVDTFFSG